MAGSVRPFACFATIFPASKLICSPQVSADVEPHSSRVGNLQPFWGIITLRKS